MIEGKPAHNAVVGRQGQRGREVFELVQDRPMRQRDALLKTRRSSRVLNEGDIVAGDLDQRPPFGSYCECLVVYPDDPSTRDRGNQVGWELLIEHDKPTSQVARYS